jgi:hypothetical protein
MKVLYIAGWMRSGTTLLTAILGMQRGALAIGELSGFWAAAAVDEYCSCGKRISICPVWAPALEEVRRNSGLERSAFRRLAGMYSSEIRTRRAPTLIKAIRAQDAGSDAIRELADVNRTLVEAARAAAGATFVIDSSKRLSPALHDRLAFGSDLNVIHMIRDARGVAASEARTRSVRSGDPDGRPPGRSVERSVLTWCLANVSVLATKRFAASYNAVPYERLVEQPARVIEELGEALDLQFDWSCYPNFPERVHIAVGNPIRSSPGPLIADDRWRQELSPITAEAIRLTTEPLYRMICRR